MGAEATLLEKCKAFFTEYWGAIIILIVGITVGCMLIIALVKGFGKLVGD